MLFSNSRHATTAMEKQIKPSLERGSAKLHVSIAKHFLFWMSKIYFSFRVHTHIP